jgi:SnoaL-like domain
MAYTRQEIQEAFDHYREVASVAGRTGNWDAFVDCFTDDVRYIEHHYGEFRGRQAVRDWIVPTMQAWPLTEMQEYPWAWYTIDAEQGWIVGQVANVMTDPGDGNTYQAANWTRLVYGGNGLFSEEEDVYNPADFAPMVEAWVKAWKQHHQKG